MDQQMEKRGSHRQIAGGNIAMCKNHALSHVGTAEIGLSDSKYISRTSIASMGIAEAADLVQSLGSTLGLQGWMLATDAISQFVYAKIRQTGVALRSLDLGRRQGSAPTGGMLIKGATTAVIEMPQELGQLVICYDMWEHVWIMQILSNRLLGLAEMVPSLVSNCGVDLGHSLGFPSEEHMVVVPIGGCDGVADRRLQGREAL
ncbi:hypothetical protein NE237_009879 [Protea cynaroides]|uniref:Uncharacterized protein n=1 Tax=Protea cynaroides TaxID=273540 RepID=A0A9Q0KYR0_9MAGN|nr:hypothetical protein NE237_009879 [Protea cynaroides]